ncbi:VapC toxin protein [Candidatus Burkholderia brachyanthoides]|nr:VapC toxin protein [Candidatus Burkholderia brachyanthoides]
MFLADTTVISETRRDDRANDGVREFFSQVGAGENSIHLLVVTVAELRQGIFRLRHKGDDRQARTIEAWLEDILQEYSERILIINKEISELWARLRVPQSEPALDKLIAATVI